MGLRSIEKLVLDILNSNDRNIKEMTVLTVESISSMFEKFIPAVEPYSKYFYLEI